jgi:hypothetical protein
MGKLLERGWMGTRGARIYLIIFTVKINFEFCLLANIEVLQGFTR